MKILIVHGVAALENIGGTEVQLRYITDYLKTQGHEAVYYTIDYDSKKPETEFVSGYKVYSNNCIPGSLLMTWKHIRRLKEIIKREKIDLVFARCLSTLFIVSRAVKNSEVPFVYQLPCKFDKKWFSFKSGIALVRKFKWNSINAILAPRNIPQADCLLANSANEAEIMGNYFKKQAGVIYNMHDVPDEESIKKDEIPAVVWINNIKQIKKPEMFIEAARQGKDMPVRFIMAGRIGTDQYSNSVREKIESVKNLEYLGEIPLIQANELFSKAFLNVITSESEGFSNGSIQGWLRGTPLLTTVNTDNVVNDNKIGFCVSSAEEIIEKIRFYIDNPEEWKAASNRARAYAVKNHGIESNGTRYEELFKKMIKEAKQK